MPFDDEVVEDCPELDFGLGVGDSYNFNGNHK